ncbi:MAG TPA: hemolysin III family protein, partial [Modicisalibacter sp.]|nr:hemolysin III family protein [Modicisalibacter sp.]
MPEPECNPTPKTSLIPNPSVDAEYTRLEEWLHSISHGIGAAFSLVGMTILIALASLAADADPWKIVGVSLYGTSLVLLYTASTLYHGARHPRLKRALKVLDHCAIYGLIAGTYTPFLLVNLRGPLGWSLFAVIWGLALGGIALKLAWPQRFGVLRVAVYLTMGWLILFAAGEMGAHLSNHSISLLAAGGIIYTVGVLFYAIRAIPYHHAIWHLFVLGGSVCHYFAVYTAV